MIQPRRARGKSNSLPVPPSQERSVPGSPFSGCPFSWPLKRRPLSSNAFHMEGAPGRNYEKHGRLQAIPVGKVFLGSRALLVALEVPPLPVPRHVANPKDFEPFKF